MLLLAFALDVASNAGASAWHVQREAVSCQAFNDLAVTGDRAQVVLLPREVLRRDIHVEVIAPPAPTWEGKGSATWKASSESATARVSYIAQMTSGGGQKISISVPAAVVARHTDNQTYIVTDGHGNALELAGLSDGFDRLRACRNNLLSGLSIDPSEADDADVDAVGTKGDWITSNDVPAQRSSPVNYRGYMIWRVDLDGRPSNCRFVKTTGEMQRDSSLCALLTKRGRYSKPAVSPDGERIAKWYGRWMAIRY